MRRTNKAAKVVGIHTYFAFIPKNYRVYVTAPGYEPAGIWLRDALGEEYDLLRRPPIEPIRIELRRTPKASKPWLASRSGAGQGRPVSKSADLESSSAFYSFERSLPLA